MENIIDLIATDSAPADISKNIHDLLQQKATEKIETMRGDISSQVFDNVDTQEEEENAD